MLPRNAEPVRERVLQEVTGTSPDALAKARLVDLTRAELHAVLDALMEQEQS